MGDAYDQWVESWKLKSRLTYFFCCDFSVCSLHSWGPRVYFYYFFHLLFLLIRAWSVCFYDLCRSQFMLMRIRSFVFLFLMNNFGSYSRACSGSCHQGKLRFKNLPFAEPCWKPPLFSLVFGASTDSVSSSSSSASWIVTGWKKLAHPLWFFLLNLS